MLLLGFGGGVLFLLFFSSSSSSSSSSSLPPLSLLLLLLLLAKVLLLLLHLITERAQFESIRDFCHFVFFVFSIYLCLCLSAFDPHLFLLLLPLLDRSGETFSLICLFKDLCLRHGINSISFLCFEFLLLLLSPALLPFLLLLLLLVSPSSCQEHVLHLLLLILLLHCTLALSPAFDLY